MIRRNTRIGRKQARNEDELQPKILYGNNRIQNIVKTVEVCLVYFQKKKRVIKFSKTTTVRIISVYKLVF